jgi:hypothetical protein
VWLATKVWPDALEPDRVRASLEASLRELAVDYVDLFLIHWPNPRVPLAETLQAMTALRDEGATREIGVSNFTSEQFREALDLAPVIVNQVEYHVYLDQSAVLEVCRERDVELCAYRPLGKGEVTRDPVIAEIAAAHDATPAQVALAWLAGQINAPWKDSIAAGRGFTFEIPLIAKDALRYGRTEITATTAPASGPAERNLTMPLYMPVIFTAGAGEAGGTAVLHNPGNENTPPKTTITGGVLPRGWRISNDGDSGRRLWVDLALRPSDVLVIDHRSGDVTLNGYGLGVPVYGQWWTVRPGDNRIRLTSPAASTATATVSAYPAYR